MQAVITGDVIGSTYIDGDYKKVLLSVAETVKASRDPGLRIEIYRGDSFQILLPKASEALAVSMIIKAGLRRYSKGDALEDVWDARLSVGIGAIQKDGPEEAMLLGLMDGEAFTRSGRALETMKHEGMLIKITTGDEVLDSEFLAVAYLIDSITGRWSTAQADAVFLDLLEGATQDEIGKKLRISQRAVGKRLEASQIDKLKPYLLRFQNLVSWKYHT